MMSLYMIGEMEYAEHVKTVYAVFFEKRKAHYELGNDLSLTFLYWPSPAQTFHHSNSSH